VVKGFWFGFFEQKITKKNQEYKTGGAIHSFFGQFFLTTDYTDDTDKKEDGAGFVLSVFICVIRG
jgi:hypothetical protein